ncbi:MAG: metalloregulator ArsR/SmtB family transcription factor [Microterricola sp.]
MDDDSKQPAGTAESGPGLDAAAPRPAEGLRDPKSLRALAHPLRLQLLGILRTDGAHSVGQLADLVDEAPGTVSYHLGTLAKFGFVVEAPERARDGRERWWRAAHSHTEFDPAELLADPEQHGAARALQQVILQSYMGELLDALEAEATIGREWVAASTHSDSFAYLTAAQLAEMTADLAAVARKWEAASDRTQTGAKPVRWILHAFARA